MHTDSQIDDLINNAPRILNEINKQIKEQELSGINSLAKQTHPVFFVLEYAVCMT